MISNKSIPQKEVITAQGAPKAIGPYSVGIRAFPWVFCSGQAGLDPNTGELVPGGIEAETRQTINKLKKRIGIGWLIPQRRWSKLLSSCEIWPISPA